MNRKFIVIMMMLVLPLFAQLPDETSGRVPELDAFHKPIYALWHEAWPAKDIQTLKRLFHQVDSAYKILASAALPGILRDKQERWDAKKKELSSAISEYQQSIAGNDTAGILKATEKVHMLYEQMVRIVRPVLKEIDDFHKVLYTLHHYYVPEKNIAMMKTNAIELVKAMNIIDTVDLPKRLEKKKDDYNKRRILLSDAVKKYTVAIQTSEPVDVLIKLEGEIHTRYQVLEKMFE